MATNRWLGHAAETAQVTTLTVGSSTNGHTFVTTINGKAITYTAGSGETTSTIATAVQALLAASEIPEFAEVTWTVATNVVTGTAANPGVPFTVSLSGTGTYSASTTTANSGPNVAGVAANWSLAALPGAGDDVLIDGGPDLLWGFDALSAAAYNSLRIKASFTGAVGLPYRNESGDYVEYRSRFFPVDTAVPITIGEGDGTGPTRVKLAVTTALDCTVHATGARQNDAEPVVEIKGNSSGTLSVARGDVGLASDDDTNTSTVTTATIDNDAVLTVGKGATVSTCNLKAEATVNSYGTVTTLNIEGGSAVLFAAPTTVTADGGTVDMRFTGTVTTVTARAQDGDRDPPVVECGNNPRAKTFTNASFTGGAALNDPDKTVTWSNAFTFDHASLMRSNLGKRYSLQRT